MLKEQFADRTSLGETVSAFRRLVKESTFINCWCMEPESEAMWRLYCGNDKGVAITVSYQEIEVSCIMRGLFIAPVKYIDYGRERFPQGNVLYPFFHKRRAFGHEREVRIVKWCSDQMPVGIQLKGNQPTEEENRVHEDELRRGEQLKVARGTGVSLAFDLDRLIKGIVVHPDAPD